MEGDTLGEALHGSATTTHAVRAAIQRSKTSGKELSETYRINPKTVLKWRSRATLEDRKTGPKVCRKRGLSQGPFYKFKSKYGGLDVSDAAKLKTLEDENAKLKRLPAYQMLDNVVLKDLLGKN